MSEGIWQAILAQAGKTKGWNTERLDKAATEAAILLMEEGLRHRAGGRLPHAERCEFGAWCIVERFRLLKNGFEAQAATIRHLEEQLNGRATQIIPGGEPCKPES